MRCLKLMLAFLLFGSASWAQQRPIDGKVLRKDNRQPLAGVTVETKKQTVITDEKGNFSLVAQPGETYSVSFIGFKKITVGGNVQVPFEQNFAAGQTEAKTRGMLHVSFSL